MPTLVGMEFLGGSKWYAKSVQLLPSSHCPLGSLVTLLVVLAMTACRPLSDGEMIPPSSAEVDLLDLLARDPATRGLVGRARVETVTERALVGESLTNTPVNVTVPAAAVLSFEYGVSRRNWDQATTSVEFSVQVDEGDGKPVVLWTGTVRPYSTVGREWQSRQVSLDPWGGKKVRLVFSTRVVPDPELPAVAEVPEWEGFPVWGRPRLLGKLPAEGELPPDVVVVMVAGIGAGRTSLEKLDGRRTTPNLEELAREGAWFTNAWSQSPSTKASLLSVLTSLFPVVSGAPQADWRLRPDLLTLPEVLRFSGYETAAFTVSNELDELGDLHRGFDHLAVESDAYTATRGALEFLDRPSYVPRFVFLTLQHLNFPFPLEPHMAQRFGIPDNLPQPDAALDDQGRPSAEALEYNLKAYDTHLAGADFQLGMVLDRLREREYSARALVIAAGLNGMELGEHGKYGVGEGFYRESLRVPLVMRMPGVIPPGSRYEGLAELLDIAPTVLSALKIKRPMVVQGRSFLPWFQGKAMEPLGATLAEWPRGGGAIKALRTATRSYILKGVEGGVLAYDLKSDPGESVNLLDPDKPSGIALDIDLIRKEIGARYVGRSSEGRYLIQVDMASSDEAPTNLLLQGESLIGIAWSDPPLGNQQVSMDSEGHWRFSNPPSSPSRRLVLLCRSVGGAIEIDARHGEAGMPPGSMFAGGNQQPAPPPPFKVDQTTEVFAWDGDPPRPPAGTPFIRIWTGPVRSSSSLPAGSTYDQARLERLRALGYVSEERGKSGKPGK